MKQFSGEATLGRGSLRDAFAVTITKLADERSDIALLDGDNANSSQAEMFAAAHPDPDIRHGRSFLWIKADFIDQDKAFVDSRDICLRKLDVQLLGHNAG